MHGAAAGSMAITRPHLNANCGNFFLRKTYGNGKWLTQIIDKLSKHLTLLKPLDYTHNAEEQNRIS
jgi:hypothetical protein